MRKISKERYQLTAINLAPQPPARAAESIGLSVEGLGMVVLDNCKFGYFDTAVSVVDCGSVCMSDTFAKTKRVISARGVGNILSLNSEHKLPNED